MCRGIAVAWSGHVEGRSYSFHLYDQNVTAITDVRAVFLQHLLQPGGEQMAPKQGNFAVRLVVGAFVSIVLAAALWAASTLAKNNAAVPTPTDAIYRAQYLNLF
jgi:hypothetical protein